MVIITILLSSWICDDNDDEHDDDFIFRHVEVE